MLIMIRGKFPLIVMWSGSTIRGKLLHSTIRGKIHGPKKSDSPIRNAHYLVSIYSTVFCAMVEPIVIINFISVSSSKLYSIDFSSAKKEIFKNF